MRLPVAPRTEPGLTPTLKACIVPATLQRLLILPRFSGLVWSVNRACPEDIPMLPNTVITTLTKKVWVNPLLWTNATMARGVRMMEGKRSISLLLLSAILARAPR